MEDVKKLDRPTIGRRRSRCCFEQQATVRFRKSAGAQRCATMFKHAQLTTLLCLASAQVEQANLDHCLRNVTYLGCSKFRMTGAESASLSSDVMMRECQCCHDLLFIPQQCVVCSSSHGWYSVAVVWANGSTRPFQTQSPASRDKCRHAAEEANVFIHFEAFAYFYMSVGFDAL